MVPRSTVKLIELAVRCNAHLDDLRAQGANQIESDRPPGVANRIQLCTYLSPDILEPGIAKKLGYATSNVRVSAIPRSDEREELTEAREGGVGRIANDVLGVGLHRRDIASGFRQAHHFRNHFARFGDVDQQRSGVYQIKRTSR